MLYINGTNYLTVCVIGQAKILDLKQQIAADYEKKNWIVLGARYAEKDHGKLTNQELKDLQNKYFDLISMADEIALVTVDGYIGEQTSKEIDHAHMCKHVVRQYDFKSKELENHDYTTTIH